MRSWRTTVSGKLLHTFRLYRLALVSIFLLEFLPFFHCVFYAFVLNSCVRMATLHGLDGRLIICASSKIFSAAISERALSVTVSFLETCICIYSWYILQGTFDVRSASSSVPLPKKNISEENTNISKNNGADDSSCQVHTFIFFEDANECSHNIYCS